MRVDVLVAEIGSTVTKVHAFRGLDTARPEWLGHGVSATTVGEGDVTAGLRGAVADLETTLGQRLEWGRMLAASSAAGGLRMTVHGLVTDMTVRAGREAALGAGAILDLVTAGKMEQTDITALTRARPGIILLAGGVEGGDREVIVHNARAIAGSGVRAPVVYAGNGAALAPAVAALRDGGLEVKVVPNVYPRLDHLDIEPARRAIQEVFEEHIVRAPGMERVREMVGGTIRPTPGAVMEASRALREVLGDLVVIDVGGATTDVHSVTAGSAEIARVQIHPEPEAKRTVEGDLGVYVNAVNVVRLAGRETVAACMAELAADRAGDSVAAVDAALVRLRPLPPEAMDAEMSVFVETLARLAAETAIVRHAGRLRHLFGPTGRVTVAEGKDLSQVEWLVGTGGALARFPNARATLSRLAAMPPRVVEERGRGAAPLGAAGPAAGLSLLPGPAARPLLDKKYVLAVLGVLHRDYPEAALALLRESFQTDTAGGGPE